MKNWIGFVAARYVGRGRKSSPSPLLSVLGIATGVLALTIIISVMNGFQLGFIESILEISSSHLRIEGPVTDPIISEKLRSLPEVLSVLPFEELNVLIRGRQANSRGALVRGVPVNALELDGGLEAKLEIEDGFFDLAEPRSIVLGAELARHLSVRIGDEVNLLSITGGIRIEDASASNLFEVTGIFRSGFYEYDLGWAFVSLETAADLSGGSLSEASGKAPGETAGGGVFPTLGVKLKNRWQDQKAIADIKKILTGNEITITSWRDYNRAFFGALRTEKLIMFILVGLIFIVVGLNIFQAQRRIVLERREEIGLLRALGASTLAVRLVFVWDGFIIGLGGALLGMIPGLLIASHIPAFFSCLETAVNFFIGLFNDIFGAMGTEEFYMFSPKIFYIKEIPSKVIPHEALLIFLFGFSSAILAAWFASGKASSAKPAEVLRYE